MYVRIEVNYEVSPDQLTTAIDGLVAFENKTRILLLDKIDECDRAELWKSDGVHSMTDWLVDRYGMAQATANDLIRVAHALRDFPATRNAIAECRMSWDQLCDTVNQFAPEAGQVAVPILVPPILGTTYREADEEVAVSQGDPHAIDPAIVERGTQAHARTQNALATALHKAGIEPRSPRPIEPNFDLAWERGNDQFVAEVKSLTDTNEAKQMRLGLGQVLWFRHTLGRSGRRTVAVLAAERRPADEAWGELCAEVGVELVWRDEFESWARRL